MPDTPDVRSLSWSMAPESWTDRDGGIRTEPWRGVIDMADRNRWNPANSSFSSNASYRAPGSDGGRPFAPTDHLATEAIAAYVDGELRMNAYLRAARHIAACAECAAEVDAQSSARTALRACADVTMPVDLLGQLNEIPTREIDLRSAIERREAERNDERRPQRGPLSAPGFPIHRPSRWRNR